MRYRAWLLPVGFTAALLAGGCDGKAPAKPRQALAVPAGESVLDALIRKADRPPAAPPAAAPVQAPAGRLEAEPGRLDFPALGLGRTASRRLTLANGGAAPLTLGPMRVAGGAAAFQLSGDCAGGLQLAPGQSCSVDITYRPQRAGAAEAELIVEQGGPPLFVPLAGQAAGPPAPAADGAQSSLVFARARQDGGLLVEGMAVPALAIAPPGVPQVAAAAPTGAKTAYAEAGLPGIVSGSPVDRSRVITADRYIPAVLENTINSQLPGRAIAVVERPVYGADGRLVLIPAGSRVIGRYQPLSRVGQARIDIGWTRILRPDGVSIAIDDGGADVMGRTGVPGDLDNRLAEKYGGSLLTSVIAAGGDWALGGSSTTVSGALGGSTQTLNGPARAANRLGNDLDQLGQRMVQENVDIRPVLTVPQGTRLDIIPGEDIWLRDPGRLQAVTPPKGRAAAAAQAAGGLLPLLPGLVELLAESPALQKMAPQTTQEVLQSTLLQQLRDRSLAAVTPVGPPSAGTAATATAATGTGAGAPP